MNLRSALLLSLLACTSARAFDAASESAERERIGVERAAIEKAFATREAECRERFVVTSCLDAARRDRREAIERLLQQQVLLDEAQRKQRAAQRVEEIRAKVSGEESRRREADTRARERERRQIEQAAKVEAAASAASAAPQPAIASAPAPHSPRAADSKRTGAYDKRQADARAHREAVDRRNAEHAAKHKPSKALPAPSAPSAASAR